MTIETIDMSRDDAIALGKSGVWRQWSFRQRALFQLRCERLCMPFDVYHEAISKAIGRDVYNIELGMNREGLYAELMGQGEAPTFDDILAMIPDGVDVVIVPGNDE